MSASVMSKRASTTGRRRRLSTSNSISSSSVDTVIRRSDSPTQQRLDARPAPNGRRGWSPQRSQRDTTGKNASSTSPRRKRRLSAADKVAHDWLEPAEQVGNLHRWSQSTASSISSSGPNRRTSLSKRISLAGPGQLGSSAITARSPSPLAHELGRECRPPTSPLPAGSPSTRSTRLSPSSPTGDRRPRPPAGAPEGRHVLAAAANGTSKSLHPPAYFLGPASAGPALAWSISASISPSVTATPSPSTPLIQAPSTQHSSGPDYFGNRWTERSPAEAASAGVGLPRIHPPDHSPYRASDGPVDGYFSRTDVGPVRRSPVEGPRRPDRRASRVRDAGLTQVASSHPSHPSHSPSPGRRRDRDREREPGPRQPSQRAMLAKALEQANTAVLLDNAHNFQGAMESYGDACALLQQVMLRSPGDEDRHKLETVRTAYTNRIVELRSIPFLERRADKALPARPEREVRRDRDSSQSEVSTSDESVVIETARIQRVGLDAPPSHAQPPPPPPFSMPAQIPKRRESLMPRALAERAPSTSTPPDRLAAQPNRDTWTASLILGGGGPSTVELRSPMESEYMPPPLSPRRPSSPVEMEPRSAAATAASPPPVTSGVRLDPERLQPPHRHRVRADSAETTSWLDTIDESGGSEASSLRSRSSFMGPNQRPVHATTATAPPTAPAEVVEPTFDAALDAAVEAAYDEGFEPAEVEVRLEAERARESALEAEREAAILQAREHAIRRSIETSALAGLNIYDLEGDERQRVEEERLLDDVTKGFGMDDFTFDMQSKSALPRHSDSSGVSGQTSRSSLASHPTTAATSIQTLSDVPAIPSLPPDLRATSPPPPSYPPPSGALPALPEAEAASTPPSPVKHIERGSRPPSLVDPQGPGVRSRRLSGQTHKPLLIDVSNAHASKERSGSRQSTAIPPSAQLARPAPASAPKTASVLVGRSTDNEVSLDPEQTPVPPSGIRKVPSPNPEAAPPSANPVTPTATLALSRLLTPDGGGNVPPASPAISPNKVSGILAAGSHFVKKNASSSSLKNRNLSLSSPDESDISPSTPTLFGFATTTAAARKVPLTSAPAPAPPLPSVGGAQLGSMPCGGMNLFDRDILALQNPEGVETTIENPPAPLEPCPSEHILRPFWLMRCLYQTITHPRGGFLSTRMFVPRDVWQVQSVKLKAVEEKISNCDFLTAALLKLAKVDTFDADAVLEEMQSLENVLDQIQTTLSKKLGSEVGLQGLSTLFRDAPAGTEQASNVEAASKNTNSSNKSSYLSWRRLRTKTSGSGLIGNATVTKDQARDGPVLNSLPMTSDISTRMFKREVNQVQFAGPNAVYMSALARLFDAAQVIDDIARRAEDPGLKHSSSTHVGLELSSRHAAEFFAFYICRFVLADISVLLDKFIKRGTKWVML